MEVDGTTHEEDTKAGEHTYGIEKRITDEARARGRGSSGRVHDAYELDVLRTSSQEKERSDGGIKEKTCRKTSTELEPSKSTCGENLSVLLMVM